MKYLLGTWPPFVLYRNKASSWHKTIGRQQCEPPARRCWTTLKLCEPGKWAENHSLCCQMLWPELG